ncbi:proton-activated chloride channel isoform 1-T2 [Clarias gariepinus]|uniref:proton-activated chloride channel isoform X1 n=1 Tax=Clarias gariepinus TaxID=13013 RepID=UPI00234DD4F0|nr:proton-activated chloride channel isoform X1 [Clarias gariepinus]XP_053366411.1 proton-activated chloride channel isoform X1 [Clarias gariepinus]
MLRKETSRCYQEFNDEDCSRETAPYQHDEDAPQDQDEANDDVLPDEDVLDSGLHSTAFNKTCLKNVLTVILVLIYLLLTTVAVFLAYQTISDFLEKLNHPVMSVSFKEVEMFAPAGIALYPGKARLLSCRHHYHDHIPSRLLAGQQEDSDCVIKEVIYNDPYTNHTKQALVVEGPTDVRNRELIFLQFSQNETEEDFSAISYMLFAQFSDLVKSTDKAEFMRECEKNYSMWTFSGGFRTWVKMSLVRTSVKENESVEFRQESNVVKYNDRRPQKNQTDELFFIVFQWRDPFIQQVKDIVTANPWNTIAILCGVLMALFKAANFAKLSIKWMIRIRKRHLRTKIRELNQIS